MISDDTVITAELLAGLDKCPFCGAEKQQENNQWNEFRCWTVIHINQLAVVSRSTRCVGCELTTLHTRVKELEAVVNEPEALWANWLRGPVKLPAGIGDVTKHQKHIAELENRLRAKFDKSEEDSKHYQERIQRLVEAGDLLWKKAHGFSVEDIYHGVNDDEIPVTDLPPTNIIFETDFGDGITANEMVQLNEALKNWTKAKEGL